MRLNRRFMKGFGRIGKRMSVIERNQGIKEKYQESIESGKDSDAIMDELALSNGIGKFYIRTILKEQGIEIERKSEYDRSDREKLTTRDEEIIDMFKNENDPDDIAKKYELTPTRVRQIIRSKFGKFKVPDLKLNNTLEKIKHDLESRMQYDCSCKRQKIQCECDTITKKYGKNIIKKIKYNLGYNVFKKSLEYKIKDMVKEAKSGVPPKDIADKHKVTLNYTYIILHDNGIRSKISKTEKSKRDAKILNAKKKGKSIESIAELYDLTPTMVRIILTELKNKK